MVSVDGEGLSKDRGLEGRREGLQSKFKVMFS